MEKIKKIIQKYIALSVQAKAAIWYTFSTVLQRGVSVLVVPLYVRLLTTSEYGNYSLFQSWNNIILIFATLNLYCGVFTKAMVDHDSDRERYTSSMQGLNTVIAIAVYVLYMVFGKVTSIKFNIPINETLFLLAFYIVYPSIYYWMTRQQVQYRYVKMVSVSLLMSFLTPVVSLILLYTTNLRERALIYGYVIVQSIFGLVFYFIGGLKGKCFYIKKYWIDALKFNIPLIPHYLSLIVLAQADRIMIGSFCGGEKAGIYSFAYQIALIMNIITNGINTALQPWLYGNLKNHNVTEVKDRINLICIFVGILTLIAILISPEIVHIMGTREYYEAIIIIPAVALSVYCTFCYGLYVNVEFYYAATKFVMIASMVGASLNILLNYIFIRLFGYVAAGYTTLACYFVLMIMHYIFSTRIMRKENVGEMYNNRFIISSSIIMFIIMLFCLLAYNHILLRIILMVILFLVIIILRKQILSIFKSFRKKENM